MSVAGTVSWNPEALDEILSNDEGRPVPVLVTVLNETL